MRPTHQTREAVSYDVTQLTRALRRAEGNTTRKKSENDKLIGFLRSALQILLQDDSKRS